MINEIKIKKQLDEAGIEEIIEGKVTKFGTSGHIPFSKRYIGKRVKIFILNEVKNG